MSNEGNKPPSLYFFVGFPDCCEKALTCSETTCNEMAYFVAKRAVTFLISRGPTFQPLDSIIQLINIWETNCAIQWIEMKNPDVDTTIRFTIQDVLALNFVPRVLSYPPYGAREGG